MLVYPRAVVCPLATLTAGTTPDVQYLGTLSALARLSGGATTPVQGTLRAQLAEAQIAHRLASRKIEHTRIGSGSVNVALEPQLLRLEANLGDGEVGTMHMNLSAQRTTAPGSVGTGSLLLRQNSPIAAGMFVGRMKLESSGSTRLTNGGAASACCASSA